MWVWKEHTDSERKNIFSEYWEKKMYTWEKGEQLINFPVIKVNTATGFDTKYRY